MFELNKTRLKSVIQNLNKSKVLVIGDFAIDEMVYGKTERISREAPVLILKHSYTNILLGAASNAAHNISTLNKGNVSAIGVCGDDYYGAILLNALKEANIDTSSMVKDSNRATTTKTRISGFATQSVTQQIVRIDRETNEKVDGKVQDKIIDNINAIAADFDAILLSDYGIGIMTPEVIEATTKVANKNNIFLAVDAQENLDRFQNATVITPNQPEAERTLGYEITDSECLLNAGQELLDKTSSEMILITRGSEGMMLFEKSGKVSSVPAFNKSEVFDVTGAGDTVVSSFLLGLCAGASGREAAFLGNLAASIVIKQFGAATTDSKELMETLDALEVDDIHTGSVK